nr:MAG TPA: hypothetical protein [Caudoviricetes sp.]
MSRAAAFLLVKIKDMNRVRGLLACAVLTLLFGCTTAKYVPVPSVSVDSVYVDRWLRDSVYLHDSVFVNQWTQGDTVFVDKVVTRYKYKDRLRHDTVAVVRADSVRVPYPVEKDLGWWEKTRLYSFPVLVAMVAVLAFVVVWLAIKQKKK